MGEIKRFNHGVCEYPGGTFSEMNQEADGDYVLHSDHEAEVARLRAEVEAYRKDAERYRWLRDEAPEEWSVWRRIEWPKGKSGAELRIDDCNMDSEIDAAMGASA